MLGIHVLCRLSSKSTSFSSFGSTSRLFSLLRQKNAWNVMKTDAKQCGTPFVGLQCRCYGSGYDENYILQQNTLSDVEKKKIKEEVDKDFEDWVPYGLCPTDKEEDIFRYKMLLFLSLSVGTVAFLWYFAHVPTHKKRDWVSREAFLELERRRQLGLPLVDKNLIPEDRILLPTMEELGDDYEIII